jgi:hypothetical protein
MFGGSTDEMPNNIDIIINNLCILKNAKNKILNDEQKKLIEKYTREFKLDNNNLDIIIIKLEKILNNEKNQIEKTLFSLNDGRELSLGQSKMLDALNLQKMKLNKQCSVPSAYFKYLKYKNKYIALQKKLIGGKGHESPSPDGDTPIEEVEIRQKQQIIKATQKINQYEEYLGILNNPAILFEEKLVVVNKLVEESPNSLASSSPIKNDQDIQTFIIPFIQSINESYRNEIRIKEDYLKNNIKKRIAAFLEVVEYHENNIKKLNDPTRPLNKKLTILRQYEQRYLEMDQILYFPLESKIKLIIINYNPKNIHSISGRNLIDLKSDKILINKLNDVIRFIGLTHTEINNIDTKITDYLNNEIDKIKLKYIIDGIISAFYKFLNKLPFIEKEQDIKDFIIPIIQYKVEPHKRYLITLKDELKTLEESFKDPIKLFKLT